MISAIRCIERKNSRQSLSRLSERDGSSAYCNAFTAQRATDRVVGIDAVIPQKFIIISAIFHQVVHVDFAVLAPTAVDVRRSFALAALDVARQTVALLAYRDVERLQVAGRIDGRTVVDALLFLGPVALADGAFNAVRGTLVTLVVATTTALQLHSIIIIIIIIIIINFL